MTFVHWAQYVIGIQPEVIECEMKMGNKDPTKLDWIDASSQGEAKVIWSTLSFMAMHVKGCN